MSEFLMDDPSFYEDFLVEAGEHFELIEQNFLTLESAPEDLDILNSIFRSVHTIKGASGFLGLGKVQSLSHIGENILDDLRKGRMKVTPEVMEILFETADTLKELVNDVGVVLHKSGEPVDPDTSDLIARLESLKGGGAGPKAKAAEAASGASQGDSLVFPPGIKPVDATIQGYLIKALKEQDGELLLVKTEMAPEIFGTSFNPFSLLQMVDLVGNLVQSWSQPGPEMPTLEAFEPKRFYFDLVLVIRPLSTPAEVEALFKSVKHVVFTYYPISFGPAAPAPASVAAAPVVTAPEAAPKEEIPAPIAELAGPPKAEAAARKPQAGGDGGSAESTIRVSQAKLEAFMNIVAELIISKTMISHLVERLAQDSAGTSIEGTVKELQHAGHYLDQVSKEVQASVLGIRMVPVKTIFGKFPRMLRDLAKATGKKIDLQTQGEDTEIDKSLIEELSDPMIHLIRNSADHGIETPDIRLAAGKPEMGTVTLRARHEGDSVIVEIEDDGKGIDPQMIRRKVVEKGLMTQERAEAMSDEETVDVIFLPGFSTAAVVSDISGRGVGMDVVRSNVRRMNGTVSVRSTVGKGSVFIVRLPLTLAIIDALLVRSGNQVFAIPGTSVEETLLVPPQNVSHLTGRKAINLRGEVLGVSRLKDLLKSGGPVEQATLDEAPVVVISTAGRRMGLIVDDFLRRQEMVIKPLAPYLASLPGISGASIMGDGGVVLILDPNELMHLAVVESL